MKGDRRTRHRPPRPSPPGAIKEKRSGGGIPPAVGIAAVVMTLIATGGFIAANDRYTAYPASVRCYRGGAAVELPLKGEGPFWGRELQAYEVRLQGTAGSISNPEGPYGQPSAYTPPDDQTREVTAEFRVGNSGGKWSEWTPITILVENPPPPRELFGKWRTTFNLIPGVPFADYTLKLRSGGEAEFALNVFRSSGTCEMVPNADGRTGILRFSGFAFPETGPFDPLIRNAVNGAHDYALDEHGRLVVDFGTKQAVFEKERMGSTR